MRAALNAMAIVAIVLALCASKAPSAFAQWTILYYDKDGRVVGTRRNSDEIDPEFDAQQRALGNAAVRIQQGEIVVANPPKGFETGARILGFSILERVPLDAVSVVVYRLRAPEETSILDAIAILHRQFPGALIDLNHNLDPSGVAGGTPEQYAREVMGWSAVNDSCGRGVRLGMIDGAVDETHPALIGQNLEYRSFHSSDHTPAAFAHGTAIAAMMIGQGPWGGLLPAAELKAANIFELTNSGLLSANVFALLKAIDWLVEEQVDVINMSVAGSQNKVLRLVLDKARSNGVTLVAAAGNGGPEAPPAYPAAYDHVIAVTAVDRDSGIYRHANQGGYIEFAAPGVSVWTAVPDGGRFQSGTSFAAPYVSVLTAIAVSQSKSRGRPNVRRLLRRSIVDLGNPGRDPVFGYGLVKLPRTCPRLVAG